MDQLIRQLEKKVISLIAELATAKKDIDTLRNQLSVVLRSENHELNDHSQNLHSKDQLQVYIDDSLDLSISSKKVETQLQNNKQKANQLSFDLPFSTSPKEPN